MSFRFNWDRFPPELNEEALEMLTQALNKGGNKPPNLVGPIIAKELDLGSTPPQLDILEISELEEDRFRAMFRMKYEGDGFLVLQTQVQANPLRLPTSELPTVPGLGVVAAAQPLVVPMLLRISGLKLHGIIVLAVSKHDGITLVFRSDPLVSVEVHSTFDSVPSVRIMLQREIEATLRSLFQEDLPVIVHDMSVNEIRRARELKERQRREHIEKQQQQIRMNHMRTDSIPSDMWAASRGATNAGRSDSGAASASSLPQSVSQHLMASQLHHRLMELSREEELRGKLALNQDVNRNHRNPVISDTYSHTNSLAGPTHRASMDDTGMYPEIGTTISGAHSHNDWAQTPLEFDSKSLAHSVATYNGHSGSSEYFLPPPPALNRHHRSNTFNNNHPNTDPESLEQFLNDDWGRMQQSAELDAYIQRREEERLLKEQQNGLVLRSTDNAVAARLASLMSMGQTLSPYTRRFEHTTMRSDVNPRQIHTPYRGASSSRLIGMNAAHSESNAQPLSLRNSAIGHDLRHFSFSSGMLPTTTPIATTVAAATPTATATTPFSSTTPPLGSGLRSPFSRNRKLRRKVHRINGLSLGTKSSKASTSTDTGGK